MWPFHKKSPVNLSSLQREENVSEYDLDCVERWYDLPKDIRKRCVGLLQEKIPETLASHWSDQFKRGKRIGSDDTYFHFAMGLRIRNLFRDIMSDDHLPLVRGVDGNFYRNWDHFYYGGIVEFLRVRGSI